ncbi:DUF3080 family protein [Eionea flava]
MPLTTRQAYTICLLACRIPFFILLLAALVSCESRDSARYIMDNYLYRLSNSLQVERNPDALEALPPLTPYPDRRDLQKSIPRININLLEFLRLSECELQRHIGAKNGALGRVMEATQQLAYDATFLRLAKTCLEQLPSNTLLAQTLQEAYQHKQEYLPYSVWNATVASKEFSYLFSLGTQALSFTEVKRQSLQLQEALKQLNQGYQQLLKTESADVFVNGVESHYQTIESSKYIGEIRLSLQIVTYTLQQADQMLEQRMDERPLCVSQQKSSQFMIVDNVFHKYYIQQVQTYFSTLHQQTSVLFSAIDALLITLEMDNKTHLFWQSVYQSDDSEWARFTTAIKRHTQYWQILLEQCGQRPQ